MLICRISNELGSGVIMTCMRWEQLQLNSWDEKTRMTRMEVSRKFSTPTDSKSTNSTYNMIQFYATTSRVQLNPAAPTRMLSRGNNDSETCSPMSSKWRSSKPNKIQECILPIGPRKFLRTSDIWKSCWHSLEDTLRIAWFTEFELRVSNCRRMITRHVWFSARRVLSTSKASRDGMILAFLLAVLQFTSKWLFVHIFNILLSNSGIPCNLWVSCLCVPSAFPRQRRRYYRGRPVDGRSHLEREEENLRRRQEHQARSDESVDCWTCF